MKIFAGPLNDFVESLRWSPKSGASGPALAFPRKRVREISRPRDHVGTDATLVLASDCLHRRDRGGGAGVPSPQSPRSMPTAVVPV